MIDGGKVEGRVWSQISLFFKWRVRGSCLKLIEQETEFQFAILTFRLFY